MAVLLSSLGLPNARQLVPPGASSLAQHDTTRRACDETLPPNERLMLTTFTANGFHGSTALEQALMSTPNTGTLCLGRNWECESHAYQDRCDMCRSFRGSSAALQRLSAVVQTLDDDGETYCIACEAMKYLDRTPANASEAYEWNLQLFERVWDAQPSKPVLTVKWSPIWDGAGALEPFMDHLDLEILERSVPPGMTAKGVQRVRWGVILMHRPWCMWNISSHAREERAADQTKWARKELDDTERLVAHHKSLGAQHVPVMLSSLAQMLWRPDAFRRKVEAFAPCAGRVDLWFTPQLGTDVFEENMLKTKGSIMSYAASLDPAALGLDDRRTECVTSKNLSWYLYAGLNESEAERAAAAEAYLISHAERELDVRVREAL